MECVKRGGDRQELHEVIREHAMAAWAEVQAGRAEPADRPPVRRPTHHAYASPEEVRAWLERGGLCRRRAHSAPVRLRRDACMQTCAVLMNLVR